MSVKNMRLVKNRQFVAIVICILITTVSFLVFNYFKARNQQELADITDKILETMVSKEIDIGDEYLADEIILNTGIEKNIFRKKDFQARFRNSPLLVDSLNKSDLKVEVLENKAIVRFKLNVTVHSGIGEPVQHQSSQIFMFERKNSKWRLYLIEQY